MLIQCFFANIFSRPLRSMMMLELLVARVVVCRASLPVHIVSMVVCLLNLLSNRLDWLAQIVCGRTKRALFSATSLSSRTALAPNSTSFWIRTKLVSWTSSLLSSTSKHVVLIKVHLGSIITIDLLVCRGRGLNLFTKASSLWNLIAPITQIVDVIALLLRIRAYGYAEWLLRRSVCVGSFAWLRQAIK